MAQRLCEARPRISDVHFTQLMATRLTPVTHISTTRFDFQMARAALAAGDIP